MMKSGELAGVLSDDIFGGLERFFGIASANGVKSVTLDCVTRKVHVEMHQVLVDEDTDCVAYFTNMLKAYNMEEKAKAVFAHWKRRQIVKPTAALYQKFLGKQVEEVLKSDFLVLDEWSYTDDFANYAEELRQWGLADRNYERHYCLLRQMVKLEKGRFNVDQDVAGRYLQSRSEKLTQEAMKCFFCFVHLCQSVNARMDELAGGVEGLSPADKALLGRILGYVDSGDWRMPATRENVGQFLSALFENAAFRDFFKDGRAGEDTDRVEVSMANILGYLMSYQLLGGGQKQISKDFFGNDAQVNNINKGKKGKNSDGGQAFKNLIPLLDKYRMKVIGE